MNVVELMQKAKDSVDLRQVFGEPYQVGEVTIIPVARVGGGGGSGGAKAASEGSAGPRGRGYGFGVQPIGVYAVKGDRVTWHPSVNVNSIVTGSLIVGAIAIWKTPRIIKAANKLFR